ncbi:MAG: hypothetical protein LUF30_07320, partial [Lachnospiraceae bacterium]|nr:hypothetical protein [Lachnospiraceae bacterium]
EEVLYQALETMEESGYRLLYLGPIYETYISLFACTDDLETQSFDPAQNEDVAEYFEQVLVFAQDSEQIQIELLGENTIRLSVSEEYQSFAEEWGITSYIDFYWLTNAFIIDYMADILIENGYTQGAISSYDGFSRNLGSDDTFWSFNIYDRVGDTMYPAALLQYEGAISIVRLRNYGQSTLDTQHYYEFEDGEIRTAYIDETDGHDKTSINDLVAYSADDETGCVDILLQMIPVYIADVFDADALEELAERGIYSIYCEDQVVYCNDPDVSLTNLYDEDGVTYTLG